MASTYLDKNKVADPSKVSEELYKKNLEIHHALEQAKELTELLKEEKSKVDIILENIIDIVIFLDENNKILTVNRAFERELGLTKKEIAGKGFDSVVTLYQDKNKVSLSDLNKNNTERKETTSISPIIKISAGKDIFGTVAISYVYNEQGSQRTILTIHDKTREHELEDMKLDFVSMAAHELRTPITSIRGYASLLAEELETPELAAQFEEWKALLSRISISAEQLLALVENLLNITKIEKGILTLTTKNENWASIINEIVETFSEIAQNKNITLTVEEIDPSLTAYVDRMRISEVLTNLLSNALNYTPPGGSVKIKSHKLPDNKWIETSVEDTGQGIAKKYQEHLFEKFFRVSGPLEQGSKGNGLGLYISKSIVTMHKGKIWVDSDSNKGAKFTFTIPIIPV